MASLKQEDIKILEYYAAGGDRQNYWRYLATLSGGDGYAKLALSVVRNDNIAGSTANAYAQIYAKNQGINMTARDWENFGVELMRLDLASRQKYFSRGDYINALNLPVQDIETYHGADFKKFQISPNAWTPQELISAARAQGGEVAVAGVWKTMLDTGYLGVVRGMQTLSGIAQYFSSPAEAVAYSARLANAYTEATRIDNYTQPNIIRGNFYDTKTAQWFLLTRKTWQEKRLSAMPQ